MPRSHLGQTAGTHLSGEGGGPVDVWLQCRGELGRELITVRATVERRITLTIDPDYADDLAELIGMLPATTHDEH